LLFGVKPIIIRRLMNIFLGEKDAAIGLTNEGEKRNYILLCYNKRSLAVVNNAKTSVFRRMITPLAVFQRFYTNEKKP